MPHQQFIYLVKLNNTEIASECSLHSLFSNDAYTDI
jgi:hypothetical protein